MAVLALQMSRFFLVLVLVSLMAASVIECTSGKDPDDYEDLEDDDDNFIFEEDDTPASSAAHDRPKPDEKLTSERYFRLLRPRLGHFERYPELRKLYEDYFEKFMQNRDASMLKISKAEDWRYVRPTADFCVSFLTIFKSKKYMINKPVDIIPLDACLEWVFLDEITVTNDDPDFERQERAVGERELDLKQTSSQNTLNKVDDLRLDETLESIYRDTLFGQPDVAQTVNGKRTLTSPGVPRKMRLKLKKYLLRLLDINNQNPGKGCHSLWLDAYTSFMEQVYLDCGGQSECVHFGEQRLDEDRYFRLIAESTRQSSINCYNTMQSSILSLMRESYDKKASSVQLMRAMMRKGKQDRQYESQKWSREMVKILQLVSGQDQDKPISLGEVTRKLWEIKGGDEEESKRLLKALGEYAIANTDMKATENDPQGVKRYARAMTRLCKPYIDEKLFLAKAGAIDLDEEEIKNKEPFLFYHLIYSLIRLTNHESIYDITKDQFEQDVLKNQWEALYLATFACQMMSTTMGELSSDTNENAYEVSFQYDSVQYVEDWPLEVMNQRLVKVAGKPDPSAVVETKRAKLNFRAKSRGYSGEEEGGAADDAAAAAALWSDDGANDDKKRKSAGSKKHSGGKSIGGYGDALSSKLKKTLGRFKFGGGSSHSHSHTSGGPKKLPKKYGFPMSEREIRKNYAAYGEWPDLPEDIHDYYPDLPADCVKKQTPAAAAASSPAVGLQAVESIAQQPSVLPARVPRPQSPSVVNRGPQPAAGYWSSNWSKEDDLPAWKTPDVVVPRRSRADLF